MANTSVGRGTRRHSTVSKMSNDTAAHDRSVSS
jgi:hypothetical protein